MRKIWATNERMPFSQKTLDAAQSAGASEIIALPCPALPDLQTGYSEIETTSVSRLIDKALILDRITDDQLTAALAAMTQRQKERWRMPSKPEIYVDDPDLLQLLTFIGADIEEVLAP